ncbi:MAG: hypothetical protein ABIX01_11040 [Chitinophagaceae bacterium]
MKNFTFLLLGVAFFRQADATILPVSVTNFQFSPANIPNVVVGDTIRFNFTTGFHNAVSIVVGSASGSVPAGAADINSGAPSGTNPRTYDYNVTVAGAYRYYCQIHSSDGVTGMIGTFTASVPLPVALTSFDVVYSGNVASATWKTVTEQNVDYFSLKKSVDGKNYAEAGRVQATGNAITEQSYRFQDQNLGKRSKFIYYMLETVDRDGRRSLSNIRMIRNAQAIPALITQINPNPVDKAVGHMMFQFNADISGTMKAIVVNSAGKTVLHQDLSATVGLNNGHIHMGDFPVGTYTVIFMLDGMKESHKVVVR